MVSRTPGESTFRAIGIVFPTGEKVLPRQCMVVCILAHIISLLESGLYLAPNILRIIRSDNVELCGWQQRARVCCETKKINFGKGLLRYVWLIRPPLITLSSAAYLFEASGLCYVQGDRLIAREGGLRRWLIIIHLCNDVSLLKSCTAKRRIRYGQTCLSENRVKFVWSWGRGSYALSRR